MGTAPAPRDCASNTMHKGYPGQRAVALGRGPHLASIHCRGLHHDLQEQEMSRTLVLVKPDAFARGLTGEIISRFENKGLKIAALRKLDVTTEMAEEHYAEH